MKGNDLYRPGKIRPENKPVTPGQKIELSISSVAAEGDGVGRYRNFAIFVSFAVPGDEVRVRVTEVRKTFARGEIVDYLAPSPWRADPCCPVFSRCGGCQWQHISYPRQLELKAWLVREALRRIGHLEEVPVKDTLPSPQPWFYRHKAMFPLARRDGRVVAGCYARRTHQVVEAGECAIQHPVNNRIIAEVVRLAGEYGLSIYDERTGRGLLRHVLARVAARTGQALAVLVTGEPRFPRGRRLAEELMRRVPAVVSVAQNINPRQTNIVLGEKTRILAGRETITDYLGNLRFEISARSFFQVNPAQAEVLYQLAADYAGLSGRETVIDAYCGTGTITLFLARQARRVYGVESVPEAVADARENARLNGIGNAEFLAGEAEKVIPGLHARGVRPQVIVLDPPRKGCEERVLASFVQMSPARIVYMSCYPPTLARDLAYLATRGYRPREVQPVDMFPHTAHVECVTVLDHFP